MTGRPWRIQVLETKGGGGYTELEAVGRGLGFQPAPGHTTRFKLDSTLCEASLDINSGSVVGVTFSAKFEGPQASLGPSMVLRREIFEDIEDKQKTVAIEVQVGDEDFDVEVYVDSNAAEPEVKRFLARAEARQAARWLIDHGVAKVRVGREGVDAVVKKSPELVESDLRGIFECLITLTQGGALRGELQAQRGGWVLPASVLTAAASAFLGFAALSTTEGGLLCAALVVGSAAGLGANRVIRPLVQPLVSGHSASGDRARSASIALSIAVGCLVVFALILGFGRVLSD